MVGPTATKRGRLGGRLRSRDHARRIGLVVGDSTGTTICIGRVSSRTFGQRHDFASVMLIGAWTMAKKQSGEENRKKNGQSEKLSDARKIHCLASERLDKQARREGREQKGKRETQRDQKTLTTDSRGRMHETRSKEAERSRTVRVRLGGQRKQRKTPKPKVRKQGRALASSVYQMRTIFFKKIIKHQHILIL